MACAYVSCVFSVEYFQLELQVFGILRWIGRLPFFLGRRLPNDGDLQLYDLYVSEK